MAINKQQSTIEYFSIHHRCTLNELYAIISYTPQLRRLNLCHKFEIDSNIRTILPITLSNLTNVSIHMHHEKFDEFEIFIRKICSKLKILRVNTYSQDIAFLNAYRWEKLILQSLSQLEEFYLRYYERAGPVHKYPMYNGQLNQFVSSFWIERQWIFETEINSESIIYLVGPYRKRWYENTQDKICNCSRDLFKSTRLTLKYSDSDDNKKLVTIATKRILTVTQVYDLEILEETYFIGALIKIINLLPENVKFEERFIFSSIEDTSKITNVYLEKMNEIEEFSFLSELCPYMKSLKVDYIKYMDVKFVLRYIFKKIKEDCNEHLCLLCLHIPTVDDEMIGKLKRMINFEKLLFNYTIKRVADHIFIFHRKNSSFSLPLAINKQQSTIEYLSIHHRCTLNEVHSIISYTSQLRRLDLCHKFEIDSNIRTILPIILSNLTDVSIHMHHVKFDEFEIFIRKVCSKLKILRVNTRSPDIAFLNAYRWEKLILQSLPQLEEFHLRYYERGGSVYKYSIYNGGPNQFISSFWIERQ
ncbi:unnamed protein product [Rotaria sp. Silwood2]|nr:unnamed protein product [Rotaria sp. Silwood2]